MFFCVQAPIKWMALESILFRKYTHQSDVWSYGKRASISWYTDVGSPTESDTLTHIITLLFRGNCVGDDVQWSGALHLHAPTGSARSAGERRTTVPASDLYHRCLHGHGQMWVPISGSAISPLVVWTNTVVQTTSSRWQISWTTTVQWFYILSLHVILYQIKSIVESVQSSHVALSQCLLKVFAVYFHKIYKHITVNSL